jgi:hypothetical protein
MNSETSEKKVPIGCEPIVLRGFATYFRQCAAGAPVRMMTPGYAAATAETFEMLADYLEGALTQ